MTKTQTDHDHKIDSSSKTSRETGDNTFLISNHGSDNENETVGVILKNEALQKIESTDLVGTLMKKEFWFLFTALSVGMGSGLTIMGNAARLCLAKRGTAVSVDLFVSLVSISNCFGRILVGWLINKSAQESLKASLCCLLSSLLVMGLAQMLLYISNLEFTFVAAVLVGVSYGALWTLQPCLVLELFGEEHFGQNYAVMGIGM